MRTHRLRPASARRAGITLTEVLIAILIMGVGLVSIATLFPLGLLRMQRAMRDSRSSLLAESAIDEVKTRDLLNYSTFYLCNWYTVDPWISESTNQGGDGLISFGNQSPVPPTITQAQYNAEFANNQLRPGLPVCYDPLWWAILHQNGVGSPATIGASSRLGYGKDFLRNDPSGGVASAWGLRRVTNFRNWPQTVDASSFFPYPFIYTLPSYAGTPIDVASDTFAAPDKIIFNGEDQEFPNGSGGGPSSLLPDLTISGGKGTTNDLVYAWFFTGYRPNVQDVSNYVGSIVVCENRVMGLESILNPAGTSVQVPQGERVYEAIWGYSGKLVQPIQNSTTLGYGVGERTVLIRWYATQPDPVLKSGSYIADVTYEVTKTTDDSRFRGAGMIYSGQRCEWYRVAGATTAEADPDVATHRRMIVTLETPVRAKTLVTVGTGLSAHSNAALVMPSVVNVVPQNFVTAGGQ